MAQSVGLSVDPPVTEILLAPGKKVVHAFQITNLGESSQFIATLHSIGTQGSQGHVTIDPHPLDPTTIPLLVNLQNADKKLGTPFTMDSGTSEQLVISIEAASTDTTQDTYFALVVAPADKSEGTNIVGISALVLTTVTPTGDLPINLDIAGFDPPLLHDNLTPLEITGEITNKSPVMFRPLGKIEVVSPLGKNITSIELAPNLIMGNSSRDIRNVDEAQHLTWQPTFAMVGPYRLRLTLMTPGETVIRQDERTVWLFPIKLSILIIGLFMLLLAITYSARRKRPIDTAL